MFLNNITMVPSAPSIPVFAHFFVFYVVEEILHVVTEDRGFFMVFYLRYEYVILL